MVIRHRIIKVVLKVLRLKITAEVNSKYFFKVLLISAENCKKLAVNRIFLTMFHGQAMVSGQHNDNLYQIIV